MKISALFSKIFSSGNTAELSFELPEGFTVTAHTGCEGEKDNSLESITAGVKAGADIVEIDLHFLPDGTPVLSHDTPKEARPTLESAFELLSTLNVKMNVDVKTTANLPSVVSLAKKYGVTEKIFFTGIEEKDVAAVKRDAPEIPYFLNVNVNKGKRYNKEYIAFLIEKVKDNGAIGINTKFKNSSRILVKEFKENGLLVSLWTANTEKDMKKSLLLSPDNITTRHPSVLRSIIG